MKNNVLLISEKAIKENSTLSDNCFPKYMLPAIKEAQEMGLQPILGSCLYERLLELVDDDSIDKTENVAYKDLLDNYIQDYLIYEVLKNIVPYLNVKLANIGTVLTGDEKIVNLTQSEADLLVNNFKNKADWYTKRLQDYLKNNRTAYPEIDKCSCGCYTIKPNLNSIERQGIYLGGAAGK